MISEELPAPDCDPVRVRLMGEDLIAFKDTDGRIGLIDQYCAHRGVSLWFGRNEESGLRCPYHGWKYDVFGKCVEVPSEEDPKFAEQIKLKSYPLVEKGGILWTYMGDPKRKPRAGQPLSVADAVAVGPSCLIRARTDRRRTSRPTSWYRTLLRHIIRELGAVCARPR